MVGSVLQLPRTGPGETAADGEVRAQAGDGRTERKDLAVVEVEGVPNAAKPPSTATGVGAPVDADPDGTLGSDGKAAEQDLDGRRAFVVPEHLVGQAQGPPVRRPALRHSDRGVARPAEVLDEGERPDLFDDERAHAGTSTNRTLRPGGAGPAGRDRVPRAGRHCSR